MESVVPYIIAIMAIIGIWMIGRYLYRKIYLRKYPLKDLDDINDAFSALVKVHNEQTKRYEVLDKIVNKQHELGIKQAQVSHEMTEALDRLNKRILKLEGKK